MKRQELSNLISLSGKEFDRLLRKIDPKLVGAKEIPDSIAKEIIKGFEQVTGPQTNPATEPEPYQPEQPVCRTGRSAPGMGGALAETQTDQLTESRQKVDTVLPKIDQILIQQIAQSAIADADLQSLTYRAVFEARNLDNQLAIAQEKIGQLKARNETALEQFDPYEILKGSGVTNPQQVFEALCEYERSLSKPSNTQSVDVDSLGKQDYQVKLEALKAAFKSN